MSGVGFKEPAPLKARFQEVRKRVRQVCEDSNRSMVEETFLSLLKALGEGATLGAMNAVLGASETVSGIRFSAMPHMQIFNSGLSAAISYFADLDIANASGDTKATQDIVAAQGMVKNLDAIADIYDCIAEPDAHQRALKAYLFNLKGFWSVVVCILDMAELQAGPGAECEKVYNKWASLKSALVSARDDSLDKGVGDEAIQEQMRATRVKFEVLFIEAESTLSGFASASVEEKKVLLLSWVDRLKAISGGMKDGTSWKAGIEGGIGRRSWRRRKPRCSRRRSAASRGSSRRRGRRSCPRTPTSARCAPNST